MAMVARKKRVNGEENGKKDNTLLSLSLSLCGNPKEI
jgi:hypothetical protein